MGSVYFSPLGSQREVVMKWEETYPQTHLRDTSLAGSELTEKNVPEEPTPQERLVHAAGT